MTFSKTLLFSGLFALLLPTASGQEKVKQQDPFQHPFANPVDDKSLPRVLIIGDSISIGYTPRVRRLLAGKANVHRPKANCSWSAFGDERIEEWVGDSKWDVIHFNFGLWDWYGWKQEVKATPESYAKSLESIVTKLKKTKAKLIFGVTTPPCIGPEKKVKIVISEERAKEFNEAALAVMEKHGVLVNNLYDVIGAKRARYQKGVDDVHYNEEGRDLLASAVAEKIGAALPEKKIVGRGGEKPNFLFLISDDQAPTMVGALGNPEVRTPHLDSLVKRGTTFTHCFNQGSWSGAVCVASRTMLITGQTVYRAPANKFCLDNWAFAKGELAVEGELKVKLWPQVFREAGYDTFLTGKWHNNESSVLQGFTTGRAVGKGFYDTYEVPGTKTSDNPGYNRPAPGNDRWTPWDPKFHGLWTPTVKDITKDGMLGEAYTVEKHTSELYADAAVEYLDRAEGRDSPFFMYVAFNAPHDPRQAPKEIVDQYPPENTALPANYLPEHPFDNGATKIRDEMLAPFPRTEDAIRVHRAEYNAIVDHMDREIGRILKALEKSGKAGNTYVIFTSDHGLALGSHGLLGKQNPYDHSIRMPFLISGPGIPEDRLVEDLIYMQSVYPTTCELAGLEVPETVEFSSVKSLATGEVENGGEEVIFGTYLTSQRLVRTKTHKLVYYPMLDRYQLFDMVKDPDEITDMSEEPGHAALKRELMKTLTQERKQLGDGLMK